MAITLSECTEMRARRRRGDTVEDVASAMGRSAMSVSWHARGAGPCDHPPSEVGEPLPESFNARHHAAPEGTVALVDLIATVNRHDDADRPSLDAVRRAAESHLKHID